MSSTSGNTAGGGATIAPGTPVVPPPPPLTITQKYSDQGTFISLLGRIGVSSTAQAKLIEDDFIHMKAVIDNYNGNVNELESYLKNINKSYSAGTAKKTGIRFSPVVMKRLIGTVFFFTQAVNCFHHIPDLDLVEVDSVTEFCKVYDAFLTLKNNKDSDDATIELPTLKGHENWITWRDKFSSNLEYMIGTRNTPLSYIIDETDREGITRHTPLIECDTLDMSDWTTFATGTMHFGNGYKEDNAKVWRLLKSSLLGT